MSSHANARRLRALLEIQTGIVRRGDGFARPQDSGVYPPVSAAPIQPNPSLRGSNLAAP
jgi:hypothetical protein